MGLITLIFGCNKQELTTSEINQKENISTHEDGHLDRFIKDYLLYVDNPSRVGLREDTLYTTSEAEYYLNHGLNKTYCRPENSYATTNLASDTLDVSINGNKVTKSDLNALMLEMAKFAGDHYYAILDSTKAPTMFNVDYLSSSGGVADFSVHFLAGVGELQSQVGCPYDESDHWYYGADQGQCISPYNNGDACDQFRRDLRNEHMTAYHPSYFTDMYSICFSAHVNNCLAYEIDPAIPSDEYQEVLWNTNDPVSGDNYYEQLLFVNREDDPNFHDCLDHIEMDFYCNEMSKLITNNTPTNQDVGNIEVGYDLIYVGAQGDLVIFHSMRVDYVTVNILQQEEADPLDQLPCTGC